MDNFIAILITVSVFVVPYALGRLTSKNIIDDFSLLSGGNGFAWFMGVSYIFIAAVVIGVPVLIYKIALDIIS